MPKLPLFFARRYLFSKKSHSVINIISAVSSFAISIPVAAMVILLSVFNGFESMVESMYQSFDPEILVSPVKGKVFNKDSVPYQQLKATEGVEEASYFLEETALFKYRDREFVGGIMRGVDSLYDRVIPIDTLITEGEYKLQFGDFPQAVVGQGVAYTLGIRTAFYDPIIIMIPRRGKISSLLPTSYYREDRLFPGGIFALEADIDGKYMIVPMDFAQDLLDYDNMASGVMIKLENGANPEKTQQLISEYLGDDFKVQTRYQQKESFYRIMVYEKWGIYFIILLVLIVASFSLIGSLAMLIIDKREDMRTLVKMGSDISLVRKIFLTEGMLIYCIGALFGLILGIILAWVQQQFGVITISAETFLFDAYPVKLKLTDLIWITVTFISVSFIISRLTVMAMIPKKDIRMD